MLFCLWKKLTFKKKGKASLSYSTQQQYQLIRCPCRSLGLFTPPMHLRTSSPPDLYWKVLSLNIATVNTPNFNGQNIFKEISLIFRNSHGLIEVVLPICSGSGGMRSLY